MIPLDLAWIRAQFPALAQKVNGHPALFLDAPGGTQVPQRVIDAMANYLAEANANTHGAFATSARSDAIIADAHCALADLLGCDADEIICGANMTTLTFALSRAVGREIAVGDEIVLTRLDHDANVAPWKALEERGARIKMADINVSDCTLDLADLARQITRRTKLVAVGYASNAVGTINDIAAIIEMAHAVGAWVFVDAVAYAPHGPIDVRTLDCDFLACSPYKFFGPHGGAIYGKREHLLRLRPYKVRPAADTLPDRWETGTQNHEALAGAAAAIDYLADLGQRVSLESAAGDRRAAVRTAMRAIKSYERTLSERLIGGLLKVPGLQFYGIREPDRFDQRTPTVAVRIVGHPPLHLARRLGERGIFTWDGNYYALNLTERLGVEQHGGMLRIGLAHYNTVEEVDTVCMALREISASR